MAQGKVLYRCHRQSLAMFSRCPPPSSQWKELIRGDVVFFFLGFSVFLFSFSFFF